MKCFHKYLFLPLHQAYTKHVSCPISVLASPIFAADYARSAPIPARSAPIPAVRQQAAQETGDSCIPVYICCSLLCACFLLR